MKGKKKKTKTETIKERLIYVYLPSHEMVKKWKGLAEKSGASISKFVIEHVDNSLEQEENKEGYTSRAELLEQIRELRGENKELHKKIKMLDNLVDRYDTELRSYRIKPFLEEDFSGIRKYEKELIDLLKTHGEIRKETVLDLLGIDTLDTNSVRGITRQMENLERYGLVKDIGGKWRWKA
jgi:hypothetical protein